MALMDGASNVRGALRADQFRIGRKRQTGQAAMTRSIGIVRKGSFAPWIDAIAG